MKMAELCGLTCISNLTYIKFSENKSTKMRGSQVHAAVLWV